MGSRTLVYTFPASPSHVTPIASGVLPAFTGTFTITWSRDGTPGTGTNFRYQLIRGGDATTCWSATFAFSTNSPGGNSGTMTVGTSVPPWNCTNWTIWSIFWPVGASQPAAGQTYTFTISGANIPDYGTCAYGTQASSSAGAVAVITDNIITAALAAVGAPWLFFLFAPLVGYAIDTGILCGTGPPVTAPINTQTLLDTLSDKLAIFQSIVWYTLCQCSPATGGQPPPIPYPPPTITQPPDWPPSPVYTCSNADICTTLVLILKRLDELSSSQSINSNQTTIINQGVSGLAYKTGTVHVGLSGSGSFAISKLVGLRIELTSGPPSVSLPGNPPYLWDVGWVSMSDGGAMLQEKRVTRTSYEWFPAEATLGTVFGYYANPGVTLTVTELLPV